MYFPLRIFSIYTALVSGGATVLKCLDLFISFMSYFVCFSCAIFHFSSSLLNKVSFPILFFASNGLKSMYSILSINSETVSDTSKNIDYFLSLFSAFGICICWYETFPIFHVSQKISMRNITLCNILGKFLRLYFSSLFLIYFWFTYCIFFLLTVIFITNCSVWHFQANMAGWFLSFTFASSKKLTKSKGIF